MLQVLKKKLNEQKGFTLIELLAVIVILGIIAAIAVPSINNLIQKSRVDAVKADANAVYNAAKLYSSQNPTLKTFTGANLTGSVLDHTSLNVTAIDVQPDGSLLLSATGQAGTVTVTYTKATYTDINTDSKYSSSGNISIP